MIWETNNTSCQKWSPTGGPGGSGTSGCGCTPGPANRPQSFSYLPLTPPVSCYRLRSSLIPYLGAWNNLHKQPLGLSILHIKPFFSPTHQVCYALPRSKARMSSYALSLIQAPGSFANLDIVPFRESSFVEEEAWC